MISYPPSLKAVGGARTGVAPANLLDVQDVNGNLYYWSDRPINAPVAITGQLDSIADPPVAVSGAQKVAWSYPTEAGATEVEGTEDSLTVNVGDTSLMSTSGQVSSGMFAGVPTGIGGCRGSITFSNFTFPTLPSGAIIEAIYPVCIVNAAGPGVSCSYGALDEDFDGQFNGGSLGALISDIDTFSAIFTLNLDEYAASNASITISFIGLAIYYTGGASAPGWGFPGEAAYGVGPYIPWLVGVPQFTFHRSLQTDVGAFVIQNLSGDTLSRDFERIARRSALDGAMFVYRLWQADAQAAWLEVHGTLTLNPAGVDTAKLKGAQMLNPSQEDTPLEIYCETCQIQWGGRRCGSTESTECSYSFQSCQVVERIMIAPNHYEKNFGEAQANTAPAQIVRRRKI